MTNTLAPLHWQGRDYSGEELLQASIPMVEIFETIEGEGMMAGYPTTFVRVFHCNLRCTWCDTPYSYAPAKPEFEATVSDTVQQIRKYKSRAICLTGGEPLIHGYKSAALIDACTHLERINDIHIETNGAIDLRAFAALRRNRKKWQEKVRFVMDYKLPASGEMERMIDDNFQHLTARDEIKFVIGSEEDFRIAADVINRHHRQGTVLMSPVWETMEPRRLVEKVLSADLPHVKVSLQLHKIIWDPDQRGV